MVPNEDILEKLDVADSFFIETRFFAVSFRANWPTPSENDNIWPVDRHTVYLRHAEQHGSPRKKKIDRMEIQLAELRSKQDEDRRRLDELEPARIHINAIRKPLMEQVFRSGNCFGQASLKTPLGMGTLGGPQVRATISPGVEAAIGDF